VLDAQSLLHVSRLVVIVFGDWNWRLWSDTCFRFPRHVIIWRLPPEFRFECIFPIVSSFLLCQFSPFFVHCVILNWVMETWPFRPHLQILLLSHSSALLYPSIPRFQNSFHHRHFYCSLQAWLLQLSTTTCPSLRSPGSNRSRTLLHVPLSEFPNPVISLPSFGLCAGYK